MLSVNDSKEYSFEQFYEKYYLCTYYYVRKKINNSYDAEDLTCNAFMYCYAHFAEYNADKASLGTWLYLIVNSRIKNYYRDKKEFAEMSELDKEEKMIEETYFVDKAILMKEQRRVLAEAIKTLPQRQQDIVILRYFYDKPLAEIADMLDIGYGNIRVLLSRALHKLQKYYQEHMD